MKQSLLSVIGYSVVGLGAALTVLDSRPSHAVGLSLTGPSVSISISYNSDGTWSIGFDPDGIQTIDLGFSYDTSLFAYNAALTGFLCDFSVGGDCPADTGQSGLTNIPMIDIMPGTNLPGTSYALNVDETAGTVRLFYDLSANPPSIGTNRQFFQIALDPLVPLSKTVFVHDQPGSYSGTLTNVQCSSLLIGQGSSCGTDTPAYGFSVTEVPGPLPILGGVAAFGYSRKLRKRIKVSKFSGASPID